MLVLSHYQAQPLLDARQAGNSSLTSSVDLNLTAVEVGLDADGVVLPGGERLGWAEVKRIAGEPTKCFAIEAGAAREIAAFSETTGWVRTLYPTPSAPTMLVSGIPMHRIKDTDPRQDTLKKVRTIAPLTGCVLDTATGLGYTAIEAARTADEVVTIELDPAGLEVARQNPWSAALFDNPRIHQLVGDAAEIVAELEAERFSRIIHDPPMLALAGDLYSGAFYRELHRLLRRGGRLFHYIGDPKSPSGSRTTTGVLRRLGEAGFTRITRRPEAFGVVAYK